MNEKVQEFLKQKKENEYKKYQETKRKSLIASGLYEKIYSPDNKKSEEYPYQETESGKYFKGVPFEVTDEEYEEIKKYLSQSDDAMDALKNHFRKNNPIAAILTVIAWVVYISGLIVGCVYGVDRWGDPTILMLVYWVAAFIIGTVYLGFAEIIKLLTEIKNK